MSKHDLEEILEELKEQSPVTVGAIYQHYKGGKYLVKHLAFQEADLKIVVVYQDTADKRKIWVRTLDDWMKKVVVNKLVQSRFTLMK